ncbi:dihydrofolate reductase family protein [Micromonospora coxensis]|uniref:Dihydrofolate reductase n=1 Tax=Micromonospora coxensis TaxID=356852 RepID=A0A1C5J1G4_9ACTN|nr:dihydrofolate reductase family protein [Micromonospora coxensis]SCG63856.1 Dihydrofolate reductase [Micromonospora coxensis]
MSGVFTEASMSLDGYIAGPGESGFDLLFRWYGNGDVVRPTAQPDRTFRTSAASARHLRTLDDTGALVVGRRLFDLTDGWGGMHPIGRPVVVVTHHVPDGWPRQGRWFTFVTDGVESAVAQARELAGDRWVGVNGGSISRQCLDLGLLDEIRVNLVPVLLGGGVPFFDRLAKAPVELTGPTVIEGDEVTHLYYRVRQP